MVITSDKCSFVNHKLHKNHFSHYEFNRPSSSICTKLTDMVHKSTNMLLLSSTNHCHLKQTYFNKRFSQCNIDSTAHTFNFYLTSLLLQLIQGVPVCVSPLLFWHLHFSTGHFGAATLPELFKNDTEKKTKNSISNIKCVQPANI